MRLCTGEHTLAEIVTRLADKYPKQARTAIERDTLTLLLALTDRGLIGYEA